MDLKTVYEAQDAVEAATVREWLRLGGVEASVYNNEAGDALGLSLEAGPQVLVAPEHFELAKQLVATYRVEARDARVDISEMTDAEGQFDWPICPQCDERREAKCQQCRYIGPEFGAASDDAASDDAASDDAASDDAERVTDVDRPGGENQSGESPGPRALCLNCQRITQIEFQELCRFCGHDFMHTEGDQPRVREDATQVNSSRVMILIGGMALLLAIMAVWFVFFAR